MSPIKRSLHEGALPREYCRPKRLRGGGFDDDGGGGDDEQLYLDEVDMMEEEEEEQQQPMEVPPDLEGDDSVQQLVSESAAKRWLRPAVREDLSNHDSLNLQWLDMDVVSGKPRKGMNDLDPNKEVGSQQGTVPVLRTFGVTDEGPSICVFIHGFTPYGCYAVPPQYTIDRSKLDDMREYLQDKLQACRGKQDAQVLAVEPLEDHQSIMGYDLPQTDFLKVFVNLPGHIPALKRVMEDGLELPGLVSRENGTPAEWTSLPPFENNVPFVLRFMVDRELGGAGWLTLPSRTYQIRPAANKETHCQVRCRCCDYSSTRENTVLLSNNILEMCRLKWILLTMISWCVRPRESGIRLLLFAFSPWILSVKDARDSSPRLRKIQSFRLPIV